MGEFFSVRSLSRSACGNAYLKYQTSSELSRSDKLYRARSRLYRNQILQVNSSIRLKNLAEIYTMHSFAHLCNLNFFCQKFARRRTRSMRTAPAPLSRGGAACRPVDSRPRRRSARAPQSPRASSCRAPPRKCRAILLRALYLCEK